MDLECIPFSSVQLLSRVQLFVTPWTAARQVSLSITNSWSLPKLMSIELVMPSKHLILCHPLLLLPPIPPSIRVFSNESTLRMRWPKYWSFSFSISPSNEYSGLISFRMDWLGLLAVQGALKSLLQHHSLKASMPGQWLSTNPRNILALKALVHLPESQTLQRPETPMILHHRDRFPWRVVCTLDGGVQRAWGPKSQGQGLIVVLRVCPYPH